MSEQGQASLAVRERPVTIVEPAQLDPEIIEFTRREAFAQPIHAGQSAAPWFIGEAAPMALYSVQGQDSNGACSAVVLAAQGLGIALDIGFMWRLKEGAAYPGERARIRVSGSKNAEKSKAA